MHRSFSLAKWQVAILGAIVEALVRAMIKAWRHFPFGRPIGTELVGNDPFGQPVTFDQAEQHLFRGPLVALIAD